MSSFPTFPFKSDISQLITNFFKKENNKSFIEEVTLDFNNIFGASGTFTLKRVYDTVDENGDAQGAHFRGSESYPNPLYVGPPDNEFYYRTCWLAYDATNKEFFGRYDDNGPDGIFFWYKADADDAKLFASDFDTLEWKPIDENGFGGGTLKINGKSTYRSVGASIYGRSFAFDVLNVGVLAPQKGTLLMFNISPSNEDNDFVDSKALVKKQDYLDGNGNLNDIWLGYGYVNKDFLTGPIQPPQWFILVENSDLDINNRTYFYRNGSFYGNGDPDSINFTGEWSQINDQGGWSWSISEYV
jgi:hypothetical protein